MNTAIQVKLGAPANGADKETFHPLTGEREQRVEVPLKINRRGPKQTLTVTISDFGNLRIFSETRSVTVPPPLLMQPISPTHWCVEDGKPTIDGVLDVALDSASMDGANVKLALLDPGGKQILERSRDKQLVDGRNPFQLALPELPLGSYKIVGTIQTPAGQTHRAEQSWEVIPRKLARVTLSDDGFPVYNGEKIFGIGIYNSGAHAKEMGESGFTVSHAYNAMNVEYGEPPNDIGAKQFCDSSAANGLKVMFLIPRGLVFHGDWEGFRRRVRMFRNHPALLCWDEEEGLARGDMKMDSLVKMRQIIREEDPNHPLMIGDAKDVITHITDRSDLFPVDQMDLGMWWWYPLPLEARSDAALEGEEAGSGKELVPPIFLTRSKTNRPIWVGIQAYKKNAKSRYPTPAEYRAQAYLSVMHGAKGIMWYGGSVTGGIYQNLEEGHWDDLKKLAKELHEMIPVFLAPEADAPSVEPEDAAVSIQMKRIGERVVLLACNRSTKPADATFLSKLIRDGDVDVRYENRKAIAKNGALADHFEPLQVHVYELGNNGAP